jgi:prepilin-type processing-associated H-X9-DG protein/prepilin-type N-terminal cleavage/methylation domain-containing protein
MGEKRANATVKRCKTRRVRRTFTLIELLVVMAIIALMLAILLPALASVRNASKSLLCMTNGHTVARSFYLFADEYAHPWRGDSEKQCRANQFSAVDFLQSVYAIDEFWSEGGNGVPFGSGVYGRDHPLICPAGPAGLGRVKGVATGSQLNHLDRLSYAMNRRLVYAPVYYNVGGAAYAVFVNQRILNHPRVPVLFEVDAASMLAAFAGQSVPLVPLFGAPEGTPVAGSPYANDRFWFPAKRHRGKMTISFVDGHVVSTEDHQSDPSWDWDYHPPIQ